MKKLLSLLLCGILLFGCSKYDDSAIQGDLNNLKDRVSKLEALCSTMNTNLASLTTIVDALQKQVTILQVEPLTNGYKIHFSDGNIATIQNGKNSGDAPDIGVEQDTDGIYYWMLNGEWLTDAQGNKIQAQGTNGINGKSAYELAVEKGYSGTLDEWLASLHGVDGTNGKSAYELAVAKGYQGTLDEWLTALKGTDGKDGQDGKDGINGTTPQLKIENNYWHLSYDNGKTWTQLGKATGENGKDGEDGTDCIFKSVTEDNQNVYFTLANNTLITIPKSTALSIQFNSADLINISAGETKTLDYTITSSSETVTIETFEQAGWQVEITEQTTLTGTIAITAPNPIRNGKILIILTDTQNNSYMKTITLKGVGNTITAVQDSYTVNAVGGLLDVPISANIDYTIQIPQDAKTWLSVQSQGENIRFSVVENESYDSRSADITLAGVDGTTSCKVTITQLQKDAIILSESDYELTYEQQTLQVVLQSNADLLVTIPEADTWITHVGTRAMTERTLNFNIASNDSPQPRTGHIMIQNTDKNISQTITLVQKGDVANALTFEDPLFKAYLTANFDTNNDKEIDTKEALNITTIKCDNKSIYSLKGIEYFTNLTTLDCSNNSVVELDLSHNTKLTSVKCQSNSLVSLNTTDLTNLEYLDCQSNSLATINVNSNVELTYLDCSSTVIKSLDVSGCTKLVQLRTYACQLLTSLNLNNCGSLTTFYLINSSTNSVSGSTITINNSSLQSVILGGAAKWTIVNIINNPYLKTVNLVGLRTLTTLDCSKNGQLTSLDITDCFAIKFIDCTSNILGELNCSSNRALLTLNCSNNNIETLDLGNNVALKSLVCSNNKISTLNVTNSISLESLECNSNQLIGIDVSNNSELKTLKCHYNILEELDVSNNTKIKHISCHNNKIRAIDISANANLENLVISQNFTS